MNCFCGFLKLCAGFRLCQWTGTRRVNPADALALLQAAQRGDARAVRELLERGVPADGPRTRRLETPLFLAAKNGFVAVARALLEHGADPSVPNDDGAGAITQAAVAGRVQIIKLMREHQPEAFHKPAAVLALHQASLGAQPNALLELLRGGAPLNFRLPNHPPVLHSAAISCANCVQILLQAGAAPNCTDDQERTALHRAAEVDKEDCVRALVAGGAHVGARTVDGRQPWQEARTGHVRNLLMCFLHSKRSRSAGSTPPPHRSAQGDGSESSPLAQTKEPLSSQRIGEGAPQNLQSAGSAGTSDTASPGAPSSQDASPRPAAGSSGVTSPGAPSSQDASPRPAAGPSGENSPGGASNQGAPASSATGPSGVTTPGTSTSSNDAPATAGAEPSRESLPATYFSPLAGASGVTLQGTNSAPSAKFSSNEHSG